MGDHQIFLATLVFGGADSTTDETETDEHR